ncbi:MAG TPA: type II toxin-antitoxin system RelE/ParE family toxin [Acidiferrobacterales bacterium]|nr:type II toxin-antitoxin system RelE/ParE family toxin [Acidiferrobacterales bacterium]
MTWGVEYTDEFGAWWEGLDEGTQIAIDATVRLLETKGPQLPFPHSSDVRGSRFGQMRELRIQHKGEPYRILYAFDPRRMAILLIGGNKGSNDRWYQEYVPRADKLYEDHLATLVKEGLINGKKV